MDCENINVLATEHATTDNTLSNECFLLRSESNNKQPHLTAGVKLDPICASTKRSRRNCLTKTPSGRFCEALPPSTMLPPLGVTKVRTATPTKERIMNMLSNIPESFLKSSSVNNNPTRKLDSLSSAFSALVVTSNLNQDAHDNMSVQSGIVCKGPAKRRVRSSCGVRLDAIRVGVEHDNIEEKLNIRKIRSNDEYQPIRKQGAKLAPLTLVHPDQL